MFKYGEWDEFWKNPDATDSLEELVDLLLEFLDDVYKNRENGSYYRVLSEADVERNIGILLSNAPVYEREFAVDRLQTFYFRKNLPLRDCKLGRTILDAFDCCANHAEEARPLRVRCRLYFDALTGVSNRSGIKKRLSQFDALIQDLYGSNADLTDCMDVPWDAIAYPELLGDSEYAIEYRAVDIDSIRRIDKPSDVVHYRIGSFHSRHDRLSEAIGELTLAIIKNPMGIEYWDARATAYFRAGQFEYARADFEEWMRLKELKDLEL